ncbi:MAG: hypothetical protein ACT4PJ_09470 [Gemmatimonadaceae bacterium]
MRIERIREERAGEWHRIAADVMWEDRDAPPQTLFIEAREPFSGDLQPSADSFLVAVTPLAQWTGERRLAIDGAICCRLREGLRAATELFSVWYDRCRPLSIEAERGFAPTMARAMPRAASFLSGGVDALSLLRSNRLDYADGHPGFIRDCILLFGLNSFDADERGPRPERLAAFDAHTRRMTQFSERANATLIPMRTNIRALYPDFESWRAVGFGAGIASTALCMPARIDRAEIGSSGLGMRHPPHATHPSLDHHFSTEAVSIRHAQAALTRFEKTRVVADWDDGLSVLRSCFYERLPSEGLVNCGECEKCVRTMLVLLALGRLDRAPTFLANDVTPAMLESVRIEHEMGVRYCEQCIEALAPRGRDDLIRPLRRKIDAYRRHEWRKRLRAAVGKFLAR